MGPGQLGHADIGAEFECVFHRHIGLTMFLTVIDGAACNLPDAALQVDIVGQMDPLVFQQGEQGSQFEGRTGFGGADRVIEILPVSAIGLTAQVSDGFDLACRYFHDDAGAVLGFRMCQCFHECTLCDILDIDIERSNDIFPVFRFNLISFYGNISASGYVADQSLAALSFQKGIVGTFQAYILGIRSCQANGTIGQQAERIESFIIHFCDEAALVPSLPDEGEAPELFILFERDVGLQEVVAVSGAVTLEQVFFIGGSGLIAEESGEAAGEGVYILFKAFAVFFAEAVGAEVDIDIEIRNGSAQHAAVFAVDGASFRIEFDKFLMKAIAQSFPVGALNALYIQGLPQHNAAQQGYADKAEIDSP